jgi:hypothetical protein
MTARKLSISIPSDVAAGMEHLPAGEVSSYVTDALRRKQAGDAMRRTLAAAGFPDYPVDPEAATSRAVAAHVPDSVRDQAVARLAAATGQDADSLRERLAASAEAAGW